MILKPIPLLDTLGITSHHPNTKYKTNLISFLTPTILLSYKKDHKVLYDDGFSYNYFVVLDVLLECSI